MTHFTPPQPSSEFPEEAFQCPHCGQMLAPSCRVCVACKHPIDPARIARPLPAEPAAVAAPERARDERVPFETARFSWSIFFSVLIAWLVATLLCVRLLSPHQNRSASPAPANAGLSFSVQYQQALEQYGRAQLVLDGLLLLSSIWVFYDARKKNLPRPMRWAAGCAVGSAFFPILWIFLFSWYLARRRKPQAACPFVEGETGPAARILIFALVALFLLGVVLTLLKGPIPH